jgi:uncharacterized protein YkwD
MPRWLVKLLRDLLGPRPKPDPVPITPPPPVEPNLAAEVVSALAAHNRYRAIYGLAPLVEDGPLRSRSQVHAGRMAVNGRVEHSGPGIAENVAGNRPTGEAVTAAWMASDKGHRENILNPVHTRIGIGAARSERGETYWCAQFG